MRDAFVKETTGVAVCLFAFWMVAGLVQAVTGVSKWLSVLLVVVTLGAVLRVFLARPRKSQS